MSSPSSHINRVAPNWNPYLKPSPQKNLKQELQLGRSEVVAIRRHREHYTQMKNEVASLTLISCGHGVNMFRNALKMRDAAAAIVETEIFMLGKSYDNDEPKYSQYVINAVRIEREREQKEEKKRQVDQAQQELELFWQAAIAHMSGSPQQTSACQGHCRSCECCQFVDDAVVPEDDSIIEDF